MIKKLLIQLPALPSKYQMPLYRMFWSVLLYRQNCISIGIIIQYLLVNRKPDKARVVDQDGEPIIGASVLVKGTTNGVITDMDGNYNLIDVPENALLAFSYIGYQTVELKANGKGLDKIMMKEE